MAITTEQISELEFLENIWAAGQYRQSNTAAFLDGYDDASHHVCDMSRIDTDEQYTAGYAKQAADEQRRSELDLLEQYADYDTAIYEDSVWQQRYGWQL